MGLKKIIRKLIKKYFGINGISLFVKKQKKKFLQKVYTKKYTADDLVSEMCKMGMEKGSVIFIHSSMTEFYNYKGTAEELIQNIIDEIGEEGTLLMPAYPPRKNELIKKAEATNEVVFDVLKTPSGAGYLTEVFRKWPGVKRSINLQHSVCAYGKLADYFTHEHHLSETAWDQKSPYFKLAAAKGIIFTFGLPKLVGTVVHCTESLLKDKYYYFSLFFKKKITYYYIDYTQNIKNHTFYMCDIKRKDSNKKNILNKYSNDLNFISTKLSNLNINKINADNTLDLFLNLAEQGITMFSEPNPELYKKNGKFIEVDETKN